MCIRDRLYIGLERYTGKPGRQWQNHLLLATLVIAQAWFTLGQPSLLARNVILSLALLVLCIQCAWLLLRRVDIDMRPDTRVIGMIFGAYALFSLARVAQGLLAPTPGDMFASGLHDVLAFMPYQLLNIALTFGLLLMVNSRVTAALERDVAQRQQVERGLRESEERLAMTFDTSPQAISITRLGDGTFTHVNPAFFAMSGYTREALAGKTASDLSLWADPEDRKQMVARLRKGEKLAGEEYLSLIHI